MSISEKYIAELYNKIQEERPIIHCITNAVTVNDCANILLAARRVANDGTSSA